MSLQRNIAAEYDFFNGLLEMEQGEELEWVVEDRNTLIVRRTPKAKRGRKRGKRG